jgi:hypothetical protein
MASGGVFPGGWRHVAAENDEAGRIATKIVMEQADRDFIRVLEDLIEILAKKGVVYIEDLPPSAREKILQRRMLRTKR